MADNTLRNKYFIKTSVDGQYADIASLVNGARILEIKGILDQGKAVNIYTAQWIDSQTEDFLITTVDENEHPVVIRENADISITFIVGERYKVGSSTIDVAEQHDLLISKLTSSDVWIKTLYANKVAHCVALDSYSPTTIKLQRGRNSYIMGTVKLHILEAVTDAS